MTIECVKCRESFEYSADTLKKLTEGQYEVQFFTCPHCGKNYHVLTIDNDMRELVMGRRKISAQLQIAKKKMSKGINVHQRFINKLQREDKALKAKQEAMLPELAKVGAEILTRFETAEAPDEEAASEA